MTDQPTKTATTSDSLKAALQLKQARATGAGIPNAGRPSERDASARSASKSKPALRK